MEKDHNTFAGLRAINVRRCEESFHRIASWSPCDWMTAVAGEVGEAANLVKKLRRIESDGIDAPANRGLRGLAGPGGSEMSAISAEFAVEAELRKRIGHELADAVIYLDLLAARLGIDLGAAVVEKFNMTSAKVGSPWKLPIGSTPAAGGGA